MELITRARTRLSVILVDGGAIYVKTKEYFRQAAELGLVDMVKLSAEAAEISWRPGKMWKPRSN